MRERVAAGWVVVYSGATFELLPEPGALDPRRCLTGLAPVYEDPLFRVYGGGAPS